MMKLNTSETQASKPCIAVHWYIQLKKEVPEKGTFFYKPGLLTILVGPAYKQMTCSIILTIKLVL